MSYEDEMNLETWVGIRAWLIFWQSKLKIYQDMAEGSKNRAELKAAKIGIRHARKQIRRGRRARNRRAMSADV